VPVPDTLDLERLRATGGYAWVWVGVRGWVWVGVGGWVWVCVCVCVVVGWLVAVMMAGWMEGVVVLALARAQCAVRSTGSSCRNEVRPTTEPPSKPAPTPKQKRTRVVQPRQAQHQGRSCSLKRMTSRLVPLVLLVAVPLPLVVATTVRPQRLRSQSQMPWWWLRWCRWGSVRTGASAQVGGSGCAIRGEGGLL